MSLYREGTCITLHSCTELVSLSFRDALPIQNGFFFFGFVFFLVQSDRRDRSLGGQSGPVAMRLKGKHLSNGGHNGYLLFAKEFGQKWTDKIMSCEIIDDLIDGSATHYCVPLQKSLKA